MIDNSARCVLQLIKKTPVLYDNFNFPSFSIKSSQLPLAFTRPSLHEITAHKMFKKKNTLKGHALKKLEVNG